MDALTRQEREAFELAIAALSLPLTTRQLRFRALAIEVMRQHAPMSRRLP